jgi:hypothetical protein
LAEVIGQLAGATSVQPFTAKKPPPLWTISKKQTEPAGGVIVEP